MSQSYPSQTRQGMDPAGAGRRLLLERLLHDALQFAALVQLADDVAAADELAVHVDLRDRRPVGEALDRVALPGRAQNVDRVERDRKSTRLNSSHRCISYAVFCLNK